MNVPSHVMNIARTLHTHGFQAWVVGGSVRDILIGRPAYDHDIATDARPEQVMAIMRRTVPTGLKHGTVTVLTEKDAVEVTTFRSDGKYTDGRRPDSVRYAKTIFDDLSRRDFTMNGIAYNPITGELVDPFGGQKDIVSKIIRTIGNPAARFSEDGLRPFRACRLAVQLGFSIEKRTFEAISASLETAEQVSVERIRDEFVKIIMANAPSVGMELLRKSGLLELVLPELLEGYNIEQNIYHRYDIYHHNLYTCDAAVKDLHIRLAALFHDIGKYYAKREIVSDSDGKKAVFYNHEVIGAAVTRKIMRRLKFSNSDVNTVTHLIRNHMFHYTSEWTDGAVRRFIRKVGLENLEPLFELRKADRIGNGMKRGDSAAVRRLRQRIGKVIEEENAITVKDLAINGNHLMAEFDLKPGPIIGKILGALLEEILDDPSKNEHDTLLAIAEDMLRHERSSLETVEH